MPLFEGTEIPDEVFNKILDQGRQDARKQLLTDENKRLRDMFGEALEGADSKTKYKDLLSQLSEYVGELKIKVDTPPPEAESIDIEKERAKWQADADKTLEAEKLVMRKVGITSEVIAHAISLGLKDTYKGTFAGMVTAEFDIEPDGDKFLFRSREADELFYVDGKAGAPKDVAEILSKKYTDLFANPKAGFGGGPTKGKAPAVSENASSSELMKAGVDEMLAAVG